VKRLVIYRAMSPGEARASLHGWAWAKRKKWFSDNPNWIRERVMGGRFNNSHFQPERYSVMMAFEVEPLQEGVLKRVSANELSLEREKARYLRVYSRQVVR